MKAEWVKEMFRFQFCPLFLRLEKQIVIWGERWVKSDGQLISSAFKEKRQRYNLGRKAGER